MQLKSRALASQRKCGGDDVGQRTQSPLRGAGLAQLTHLFIEFPYGPLLALNECLGEIRSGGHQRVRPPCHGLDVFLERSSLLECAPDCIVAGFLSFRGLREFLVVDALGLILPLARHDDVLHGFVYSVAFGNRLRTFSNCFVRSPPETETETETVTETETETET